MFKEKEFDHDYFRWLCNIVNLNEDYYCLAMKLHNIGFYWTVELDENRNTDAVDLRNSYYGDTADETDNECSVFEVMVALANRIENDIMYDCEYENRANNWFMIMLDSLILSGETNAYVDNDSALIDETIYTWLDRDFKPDGYGSLFYIEDCKKDLRSFEIWDQMMMYFNVYYF